MEDNALQWALGRAIERRRLLTVRAGKSMTQDELVDEAAYYGSSLDQSGISKIETGKQWTTPANLSAIAKALGVPVSMLFKEAEELQGEVLGRDALEVARDWQALPPDKREAFKTLVSSARTVPS